MTRSPGYVALEKALVQFDYALIDINEVMSAISTRTIIIERNRVAFCLWEDTHYYHKYELTFPEGTPEYRGDCRYNDMLLAITNRVPLSSIQDIVILVGGKYGLPYSGSLKSTYLNKRFGVDKLYKTKTAGRIVKPGITYIKGDIPLEAVVDMAIKSSKDWYASIAPMVSSFGSITKECISREVQEKFLEARRMLTANKLHCRLSEEAWEYSLSFADSMFHAVDRGISYYKEILGSHPAGYEIFPLYYKHDTPKDIYKSSRIILNFCALENYTIQRYVASRLSTEIEILKRMEGIKAYKYVNPSCLRDALRLAFKGESEQLVDFMSCFCDRVLEFPSRSRCDFLVASPFGFYPMVVPSNKVNNFVDKLRDAFNSYISAVSLSLLLEPTGIESVKYRDGLDSVPYNPAYLAPASVVGDLNTLKLLTKWWGRKPEMCDQSLLISISIALAKLHSANKSDGEANKSYGIFFAAARQYLVKDDVKYI